MSFQNETIVESKSCRLCSTIFNITHKDLEFYEKVSPVFGGKKYHIPSPTLCPDCREQRRLSFRNERKLYRRKCDFSGKEIISMYSPDKTYTVYDQEIWWSDKWDAFDYGKEFDFNKSFFEQFEELLKSVPIPNIMNRNSENSEYTNICAFNKNCYLLIESSNNEDCFNSYWLQNCINCADSAFLNYCQNCYQTIDSINCNKLFHSQNCENSNNSYFLKDCTGCNFCIGCIGLKNKEYYVFNNFVGKEQYQNTLKKLIIDFEKLLNIFKSLEIDSINKYAEIKKSENCIGDYIIGSKDCINCFEVNDVKNCKNSVHVLINSSDCYDVDTVGLNSSLIYESINTAIDCNKNSFCIRCWSCNNTLYSNNCDFSSNLFGCIGLRNKSYCILNKQYTKEEYEELVPRIIEHMQKTGEWGEFFPSSISPFGYNETVAQEYFLLSREEVLSNSPPGRGSQRGYNFVNSQETAIITPPNLPLEGRNNQTETFLHGPIFNWSDYEAPFPKVEKIIPASKLPNDISSIPDDILNWAIECEVTKKPFRIIKQELEFYRKHNLPIPHKHPDQRHLERMQLRNPRKLFTRHCDKCTKEIQTTYSPERPEIVYCEECYNKEVY